MEEVQVQTAPESSGMYAKQYAASFWLKIFAFFVAANGGLTFYTMFNDLRAKGFSAEGWYTSLIYVFGYVFVCVGLFSVVSKNREDSKVISDLRAASIGFGILALTDVYYVGAIFQAYFKYFTGTYSFQQYLTISGKWYYLLDYAAAALGCIFAILLIRNVIGAIKGNPAGIVPSILAGLCGLMVMVPWILFFIKFKMNIMLNADVYMLSILGLREAIALFGCIGALVWIYYAKKINNYIVLHDPEEGQETADSDAEETAEEQAEESAEETGEEQPEE